MGFENRDYFREPRGDRYSGSWGMEGLTPAVKWILIINVAVFLLQIFIVREVRTSPLEMMRQQNPELDKLLKEKEAEGPEAYEAFKKEHPEWFRGEDEISKAFFPAQRVSIVQEWLELDGKKAVLGGQVWRLLTYAFCHDRTAIWHIFFNLLLLYWFGGTLESMYGTREFVLFYLTAAVVSGLAFVGLNFYTGSLVPCVGASGAVIAVMMLYTMHFPYQIIYVCWLIPVQMRWVMIFYAIWDLHPILLALSGDQYLDGVAHAAHIGGLAFGFLYAKYEWRLAPLGDWISLPRWKRRGRLRLYAAPEPIPVTEPDPEMGRVDEILQKICETGQASLTEEERAVLRGASERLKKRGSRRE
jgi:membrane associated rhomboid family serine protease